MNEAKKPALTSLLSILILAAGILLFKGVD
jgi:hypothetical protein